MLSPRPTRLDAPQLVALMAGVAVMYLVEPARAVAQDSTRTRSTGPVVAPGTRVRVRGRDLAIEDTPATVIDQRGDTLLVRVGP